MRKKKSAETRLIVFKVSQELHLSLARYAKAHRTDSGKPLSPALAARKLMNERLNQLKGT